MSKKKSHKVGTNYPVSLDLYPHPNRTGKGNPDKQSETAKPETTASSATSQPTGFKVRKYRWWIPRFVYQAVVNDIIEIEINSRRLSAVGKGLKHHG